MKYKTVNKNIDHLKSLISVLPNKPGIYQYFDQSNTIIYIGKAKDLRKRVSSYFTKNHDHRKTALLVRNIVDIKHMVVESEQDALLLENNLIKKYQPRYNIRLKDDKSYPWICIKNEPFPRVFKTRNLVRDGSKYFGPYTSIYTVRTLLDLFKSEYKLRTCNYNLTPENIASGKYKVCLEYHIGNCKGPCEGHISAENYDQGIADISDILKGNISGVIKHLEGMMAEMSANLNFEEALAIKENYDSLKRYQSRSTVVSPVITDVDVYSIEEDENFAFINYLKIIKGAIIQTFTLEIKKGLDETSEELLLAGIVEIRQKIFSNAREILVPIKLENFIENVTFRVPQRGEKKELLDLSKRNAKYFRLEKDKQAVLKNPAIRTDRILNTIKKDLQLKGLPERIECFDNSNLQGTNPVAACVVFKDAKPAKKEYRHFNVKTVEGPNDFASMEEIVYRRYRRLLDEKKPLPQLIVVDGGKGQLSATMKSIDKLELRGKITVIGIAKRLEEIYFPGDSVPIYINKNSETLKVIQHLRDEAHRFGITFHRDKRSKAFITSELGNINGVGEKTTEKLLKDFKSVKQIKQQKIEALEGSIGKAKARIVFDYFQKQSDEKND
ncbi:excinuclease ABC subunit UvrC [Draconibacterium sp. IB214405]|uniref:excinuclease ABC subunit UvrC n=1 Tax=Draconibacterium sp. IB214405 TaxID=3097352 RepID=UPI002A0BE698|nr:excinuclease ABC subunit UvrC [Draconibacterium sp. IB214405]MDX8337807.1 excinuclease ABC subunit UvrC [Draconibacterium sp. IB214405]